MLLPAGPAALWTGWVTSTLPFYPAGWPLGLTVAAGLLGVGLPRFAFPFALAVSVLPLANISLGLAALFALVAAAWVGFSWNDPRGNAVVVAGPLLGPLSALALLPLLAGLSRHPLRRALQTLSVFVAATVAAIDHRALPFEGRATPIRLGIAGVKSPLAAAAALAHVVAGERVLLEEGAVLALAAVAVPYLWRRGPLVGALSGGSLLCATAQLIPSAPLVPLIAVCALSAGVLAIAPRRAQTA